MGKHRMWVPSTNIGLEHLHLKQDDRGYSIDGVVIGINDRARNAGEGSATTLYLSGAQRRWWGVPL